MSTDFPTLINTLSAATLDGGGHTDAALRREVSTYTAVLSQDYMPDENNIPADLKPFLYKMAQYAYKITDTDFEQLKATYSEEELFELTISAAFGAGLARLERGLELLDLDSDFEGDDSCA